MNKLKQALEFIGNLLRLIIGVIIGVPFLVMVTIICTIGELIERRLRKNERLCH